MNNSELFAVIRTQIVEVKEIPPPESPHPLPAHEAKPYRAPDLYLSCPAERWPDCAKVLKNDERLSFDFLTMVTAVDVLKTTTTELARLDVIYHFFSFQHRHKMVVKISLPRENPVLPSVISLWPTADWQEREVYDMFGIKFEGHPNCTRILMWEGFPGWPLRKDYQHIPDRYDD